LYHLKRQYRPKHLKYAWYDLIFFRYILNEYRYQVNGKYDLFSWYGQYWYNIDFLESTCKYHTKGDNEIREEQIKAGKEKAMRLLRLLRATSWQILMPITKACFYFTFFFFLPKDDYLSLIAITLTLFIKNCNS